MKDIFFCGTRAILVENEQIRVVILPDNGGKIASFILKNKEFELLFQNPHEKYNTASLGANFSKYESCGFDDVFPTVDECALDVGGRQVTYPDHGEIWSAKMHSNSTENGVKLHYNCKTIDCSYEKHIFIKGNTLHQHYEIINTGRTSFPFIWLCHCLVQLRKNMQLILPRNAPERVSVFKGTNMEKWYLNGKVDECHCGYLFPEEGVEALFEYDTSKLPYLGFWSTNGGYRGDYTCALEPTTGFYDSVERALKNGKCMTLKPGEQFSFDFELSLKNS